MIGRSQIEDDNEAGLEEPRRTSMAECFSSVMTSMNCRLTCDDFVRLFEDVGELKQNAMDSRRLAQEVTQLRRELDDMKSQMAEEVAAFKGQSSSMRDALAHGFRVGLSHLPESGFRAHNSASADQHVGSETSVLSTRRESYIQLQENWATSFYEFRNSVWDVLIFINLGAMYRSDEFLLVIVGLCNIMIQVLFTGLVAANMTVGSYTGETGILDDMLKWRVAYAHNPDFADIFTNHPLAKDLCDSSDFMMQGAQQATAYRELEEYVQQFLGLPAGAVLCMLSAVLWMLTCWKELQQTVLCQVALYSPHARAQDGAPSTIQKYNNSLSASGDSLKTFRLQLNRSRSIGMALFITLPRLGVLIALWLYGTSFLLNTVQLSELILNAVALEVVLSVDELLFEFLCPSIGRLLVSKTMPLKVGNGSGTSCIVWPHIKLVAICGVMSIFGASSLGPMVDRMNEVKDVMCSGETNFLGFQLAHGPVVTGVPLFTNVDAGNYRSRAILQRAGLIKTPDTSQKIYYEGKPYVFEDEWQKVNVEDVQRWASRTHAQLASAPLTDRDGIGCKGDNFIPVTYPHTRKATWESLRAVTGNSSVRTMLCADIERFCWENSDAGRATRMNCARTCGLHDPLSGQALNRPEDGALKNCAVFFEQALRIPASRKNATARLCTSAVSEEACIQLGCRWFGRTCQEQCYEPAVAELQAMPAWEKYIKSLTAGMIGIIYHITSGDPILSQQDTKTIERKLRDGGCAAAKTRIPLTHRGTNESFRLNICDPDFLVNIFGGLRSARLFCPISCGCIDLVRPIYTQQGRAKGFNWTLQFGVRTECWERCFTDGM